MKGKAFRLGDGISTDDIIPGRFFHLRSNLPELVKHTLEDMRPDFVSTVQSCDFVVGGRNFGLGSSREHAALVLKIIGVGAILARSVARIFFRNAINIGLPVVICDTSGISDGDELEVDLAGGRVSNLSHGITISSSKLPPVMLEILSEGGLIPYIRKYGDFKRNEK